MSTGESFFVATRVSISRIFLACAVAVSLGVPASTNTSAMYLSSPARTGAIALSR